MMVLAVSTSAFTPSSSWCRIGSFLSSAVTSFRPSPQPQEWKRSPVDLAIQIVRMMGSRN